MSVLDPPGRRRAETRQWCEWGPRKEYGVPGAGRWNRRKSMDTVSDTEDCSVARPRFRLLLTSTLLVAAIVGYLIVWACREIEYTGMQLHELARAIAAYLQHTGGVWPESYADLRRVGLINYDNAERFAVTAPDLWECGFWKSGPSSLRIRERDFQLLGVPQTASDLAIRPNHWSWILRSQTLAVSHRLGSVAADAATASSRSVPGGTP